jgi:hypothetical protein
MPVILLHVGRRRPLGVFGIHGDEQHILVSESVVLAAAPLICECRFRFSPDDVG